MRALPASVLLIALLWLLPAAGTAQLIGLKTVPIAAGDQFRIFPSARLGMAGVDIAVEDSLLDPFVNPATGARQAETRLFGSPSFYDLTGPNGGAKTLPVGSLLRGEHWFGAIAFALQELEAPERGPFFGPLIDPFPGFGPERLSDRSARNLYAYGAVGRRVGESAAIGASVFLAGLEGVEGVTLLYPRLSDIDQDGSALGVRLGLTQEWDGDRSLEAIVLYNRWDMTHDVRSFDWVWGPERTEPEVFIDEERNRDRTDTWGLHLNYVQPMGDAGWRMGGIVTGNYKTHPKIPNYEIQNIPRDPGNSWAGNFGVGVSKVDGPAVFALDLVYEPIRSDTWQEADERVVSASGKVIAAGERTIDNDFTFSNALIRLGAGRVARRWEVQVGLALRSISYELDQTDRVLETSRRQEESWLEWTPTWGGALRFDELEIRYFGQLTSGTGLPGIAFTGRAADAAALAEADYILAPAGPLTLQETTVFTHQLSISLPI